MIGFIAPLRAERDRLQSRVTTLTFERNEWQSRSLAFEESADDRGQEIARLQSRVTTLEQEQQDHVTVAAHRARCEAYEREHAGEIVELVREVSAMRMERDALRETLQRVASTAQAFRDRTFPSPGAEHYERALSAELTGAKKLLAPASEPTP